ncbi:MAG: Rpn family recombination-promoting nuclease/putative transposase [Thermodesulfobacteriota bacterium]|nr:Rpn family recombination-promoting nuclease/putative transposase [Thermodesulfobacteriota bacterium]
MSNKSEKSDFDSPWQESLEVYFEPFMALLFPQAYKEINWSRGYKFLDKELMQITQDAEIGRRRADKLIQVWLADGKETWILVHIEVQSQKDLKFAERMFVYHYRIYDRYKLQVVSLAVLADETAKWRPEIFSYRSLDWILTFPYIFTYNLL